MSLYKILVAIVFLILGKIWEFIGVESVWHEIAYLYFYENIIENLKNELEDLENVRVVVQLFVDAVKNRFDVIGSNGQAWLDKVNEIKIEVNFLLGITKNENSWFLGRYLLSREAKKKTEAIVEHRVKGERYTVLSAHLAGVCPTSIRVTSTSATMTSLPIEELSSSSPSISTTITDSLSMEESAPPMSIEVDDASPTSVSAGVSPTLSSVAHLSPELDSVSPIFTPTEVHSMPTESTSSGVASTSTSEAEFTSRSSTSTNLMSTPTNVASISPSTRINSTRSISPTSTSTGVASVSPDVNSISPRSTLTRRTSIFSMPTSTRMGFVPPVPTSARSNSSPMLDSVSPTVTPTEVHSIPKESTLSGLASTSTSEDELTSRSSTSTNLMSTPTNVGSISPSSTRTNSTRSISPTSTSTGVASHVSPETNSISSRSTLTRRTSVSSMPTSTRMGPVSPVPTSARSNSSSMRLSSKSKQVEHISSASMPLASTSSTFKKKLVLKVNLCDDKTKQKVYKRLSTLPGVEYMNADMKENKLIVMGDVDPIEVVHKLRKFWYTELLAVEEPSKQVQVLQDKDEPREKEEEKKKKEDDDDKKKVQIAELVRAYQAYNPYATNYYYVRSAEENPDACVIS